VEGVHSMELVLGIDGTEAASSDQAAALTAAARGAPGGVRASTSRGAQQRNVGDMVRVGSTQEGVRIGRNLARVPRAVTDRPGRRAGNEAKNRVTQPERFRYNSRVPWSADNLLPHSGLHAHSKGGWSAWQQPTRQRKPPPSLGPAQIRSQMNKIKKPDLIEEGCKGQAQHTNSSHGAGSLITEASPSQMELAIRTHSSRAHRLQWANSGGRAWQQSLREG